MTPLATDVARTVTNAGSPVAMGVISAIAVVVLWRKHRLLAQTWIAAEMGGSIVDFVLKEAVRRQRPPYSSAYLYFHSYSFPSGHAMGATIALGMLAFAIHQTHRDRPGLAALAYAAAAALTFLICATRVYLGVHFPSDVIGGVFAGLAWLAVCLTGAHVARGRAATRATPTA
jgi:undecaprenyl-diphosphatase